MKNKNYQNIVYLQFTGFSKRKNMTEWNLKNEKEIFQDLSDLSKMPFLKTYKANHRMMKNGINGYDRYRIIKKLYSKHYHKLLLDEYFFNEYGVSHDEYFKSPEQKLQEAIDKGFMNLLKGLPPF